MAPMAEISAGQAQEVFKWVAIKRPFSGADVAEISEAKTVAVSIVEEEPLVVYHDKFSDKRTLICSDKHAKQLEKAGVILDFPKTRTEIVVNELVRLISQSKVISEGHGNAVE